MIEKQARLSDCGKFRYTLYRRWSQQGGKVVFLMYNPSTADGTRDDPTIRRCMGFASRWGYGELVVINLFAYRSSTPAALRYVDDAVGPQANYWIDRAVFKAKLLVCAWGCAAQHHVDTKTRVAEVLRRVRYHNSKLPIMCLGTTKGGTPRHPLMLSYAAVLQPYSLS